MINHKVQLEIPGQTNVIKHSTFGLQHELNDGSIFIKPFWNARDFSCWHLHKHIKYWMTIGDKQKFNEWHFMILYACLLANHVLASNFTCSSSLDTVNDGWITIFSVKNMSWMRLMLMRTVAKTSAMQQCQIWCNICDMSLDFESFNTFIDFLLDFDRM